jgi:3-isopropylmalate dehydrogenase
MQDKDMHYKGKAHCYGRDIDTDVIIPARYLNTSDPQELAKHCLEGLDPTFVAHVRTGDILVAAENFGCGSSREHAPLAIQAAGIDAIIAKSFARIFYRNAINIGLPIMECPEAVDAIADGDVVRIDTDAGTITNETTNETFDVQPFPLFIREIIEAGGLINRTKKRLEAKQGANVETELTHANNIAANNIAANNTAANNTTNAAPATATPTPTNASATPAPTRTHRICLIPGDGIGPEIIAEACKVLGAIALKHSCRFSYTKALLGGVAIDECGDPLPFETLKIAKESDAVLLGAVGGPKWDTTDSQKLRPEQGLLGIRKAFDLYANVRPIQVFPSLYDASPIKSERLEGVDILMIRELTGGLYFGARKRISEENDEQTTCRAFDTLEYREHEIERILRFAFETASRRSQRLHSVDKANILETSRLWRETALRLAAEYPQVTLTNMLVDNAAMQLLKDPCQFDVIVTENMFGDILSDEASMLTGSLGMLASASLGASVALFEPAHGSAPDLAGTNTANPLAQILSAELMLRYRLNMHNAADDIARAVAEVLEQGWRTADIATPTTPSEKLVTTKQMGDLVSNVILLPLT